jgi:hypothetical protein
MVFLIYIYFILALIGIGAMAWITNTHIDQVKDELKEYIRYRADLHSGRIIE